MGMFELAVSGKIIDNGDSSVGGLELRVGRLGPDFGPFRAGVSIFPSLGHLKLGRPGRP